VALDLRRERAYAPMGIRVPAGSPATDALARKRSRKESAQASTRRRAEHPNDSELARKRRDVQDALKRAQEARGETPEGYYVLELPRGFEALYQARDATRRRVFHHAALSLLASYNRDAESADGSGWRRVPTVKTQRERAEELGITEDYVRKLNRELLAFGAMRDGGLHDAGDGERVYRLKYGPHRGKYRKVTLKRRVWRLAPVAAILASAGELPQTPPQTKADNLLPPDLSTATFAGAPSDLCAVSSASSSDPNPFAPATVHDQLINSGSSLPYCPDSALQTKQENAADAAPIDQITNRPTSPPRKADTQPNAATERPTAAPRGEGQVFKTPSEALSSAPVLSSITAGGLTPPDPRTARHQKGGSPPPFTPGRERGNSRRSSTRLESKLRRSPVSALKKEGGTGGGLFEQRALRLLPPLATSQRTQPEALPPGPSVKATPSSEILITDSSPGPWIDEGYEEQTGQVTVPSSQNRRGRPSGRLRSEALPQRSPSHETSCNCLRCWVADSVRSGEMKPPPHVAGCRCGVCAAWRAHSLIRWRRFKNPVEAIRAAVEAAAADQDPVLSLLRRLQVAFGAGRLLPAEHQRLVGLLFEGQEQEVDAALSALDVE